jgi:hypothetical protein
VNDQPTPTPDAPTVPVEIASALGSTFQRLLAESAFADAWTKPELSTVPGILARSDLHVLVQVDRPWNGRILLSGDEATVRDLAAGFHSIPDAMVDRTIALEFLVELANRLLLDLFCATEEPVSAQEPSEPTLEQASGLWERASSSRVVLGCNDGLVLAALLAGS